MLRHGWKYKRIKEIASEPDFPKDLNDPLALEGAFCLRKIDWDTRQAFRISWLKFRDYQRKQQRAEKQ